MKKENNEYSFYKYMFKIYKSYILSNMFKQAIFSA